MIMRVPFEDIQRGLSEEQLRVLKKTGVVIVTGGVQQEVKLPFHLLSLAVYAHE